MTAPDAISATVEDDVVASQRALDLAREDPGAAVALAREVLDRLPRPRTSDEVRAVVTAQRATGQALRNLGRTAEAVEHVRRGVAMADRRGFRELAAEGRMTLSFLLLEVGKVRAALSTIDQALGSLEGLTAAQARSNRALILHRAGRPREALAEYAAALTVIRRAGDTFSESLLRGNRAQLYAEEGSTAAAVADLEWARSHHLQLGRTIDAADTLWNLGSLYAFAGDYPRALELFDLADAEWGEVDRPQRFTGRAETLLDAGLALEAESLAREGIAWASRRGWRYAEAEARLWSALATLSAPDPDLARSGREARAAASAFAQQGRPDWEVLAQHVELVVRLRGDARPADLDRAVQLASALRDRGREAHAADLRVAAGRVALERGDLRRVRTLLGPLTHQTTTRQLEVRGRAWFARGLLQVADHEPAADASLLRAWRTNDQLIALRGATELRAAAASHAGDIVAVACDLAVDRGSPRAAFDWAERGRSVDLRRPPARGPRDPELAAALARLRWSAMIDETLHHDDEPDPGVRARRRRDEAEVLRLTRRAPGLGPAAPAASWSQMRSAVGAHTYVQLLLAAGDVWGVRLDSSGADLVRIAALDDLLEPLDTVLFSLRRLLAAGPGASATHRRIRPVLVSAAARMLEMLEPARLAGAGDAVVSPVGPLCRFPWSALGLVTGMSAPKVAPSATTWLGSLRRGSPDRRRFLVVAGPDLVGAEEEALGIGALHPSSRVLVGSRATVDAVIDELPSATTVHLAAHGRLRRDNPLFSSLVLHDGPLTAYDLETVDDLPAEFILSACSSGAGHAMVGDEVLGLAWSLLGCGASRVLAPLLPVPDDATAELMVGLHRRLDDGVALADAWRALQQEVSDDAHLSAVTAAFSFYGD